jgi:hypothetical protein
LNIASALKKHAMVHMHGMPDVAAEISELITKREQQ